MHQSCINEEVNEMTLTGTLSAAGDLVVRERIFGEDGAPLDSGYGRTLDYLRRAHTVWGSLEVQFTERGYRTDSPIAYRVDAQVAQDLGRAGFTLMTVATNHTGDFGEEGFLDTLSAMREAGVQSVGGGANLTDATAPLFHHIGDLRVATLAVSCLLPPDTAATDERPGIAPIRIHQSTDFDPLLMLIEPGSPLPVRSVADQRDVARLCDAIAAARTEADFVLVSIHWGYGKGDRLASYQHPLAEAVVAAGADLVLGNHTHSPGPIEFIDGVPIIYSLGNHIAQQDWASATPKQQAIFADIDEWSAVATFSLAPHRVTRIELAITQCPRSTGLPEIIDDERAAPALDRLERLYAPYGTSFDRVAARAVIHMPEAP